MRRPGKQTTSDMVTAIIRAEFGDGLNDKLARVENELEQHSQFIARATGEDARQVSDESRSFYLGLLLLGEINRQVEEVAKAVTHD